MRLKNVTLFLLALLLTGCANNSRASKAMEIADSLGIRESSLVTLEDSHGGFHGDGDTLVIFQTSGFQPGEDWQEFPLPDSLSIALWGGMAGDMQWGSLLTDETGEPLMPEVENGHYYFRDRHSESTDPEDPSDLLSRSSFNFTLAVYDGDSETVYYFEKDT